MMSIGLASVSFWSIGIEAKEVCQKRKMPVLIFCIKIFVAMAMVVTLSLIAEKVSPRISGIIAGYPLGAAIALYFYGLEINPDFASESAFYTLLGLIASQSFVYIYYKASRYFIRFSVLISSGLSIFGYFYISYLLRLFNFTKPSIITLTLISLILFIFLFRGIENVKIDKKISLSNKVIFVRAGLAASIVILITSAAKIVGVKWAGLFSAFPITLFPLILIVHISYDKEHVHTIIKNFPVGLGALIIYSLFVYKTYPIWGIYIGTAVSFIMATIYLFGLFALIRMAKKYNIV